MPVTPGTGAPPPTRLAWIDMARGFCVIAVVLMHVGLFHVFPLSPDSHGRPLARAWVLFNTAVLADLRMPLLLMLSGFLARSKVRRGLGNARTRLAIATNAQLYVVWTLVFFALGVLFYPHGDPLPFHGRSWPGLGVSLLYPVAGPLWFVYVLFVSLTVLAATRKLPIPLVLAGFFAVGWAVMALTHDAAGLPRAIFYACGALLGDRLIALTESRVATAVALLAYAVLMAVVEPLDPVLAYPLTVIEGVCAAVAFLAIAKIVARLTVLRAPGAWVGRRTLGIYVLHWPVVALLTWFGTTHPQPFQGPLQNQVVEVLYPIGATAAVVTLCMGLEQVLRRVGLGVLFDLPEPVKHRITTSAPDTTTAPVPGTTPPDPRGVRARDGGWRSAPPEPGSHERVDRVRLGDLTAADAAPRYRREDDPTG